MAAVKGWKEGEGPKMVISGRRGGNLYANVLQTCLENINTREP